MNFRNKLRLPFSIFSFCVYGGPLLFSLSLEEKKETLMSESQIDGGYEQSLEKLNLQIKESKKKPRRIFFKSFIPLILRYKRFSVPNTFRAN